MLNIPDEVKALFSSDTVKKNFHVRFPDGEYTDLNNENILSESVNFTESLCSQQYFKFGLAEASQIEFTAVGIPNVRGAYIECAIEIDCTRLGAAWASDNPVDPTLDFLEPQTCEYQGKIFYRVPYGLFKVDTCPRDKGAMFQRKITAYSEGIQNNKDNALPPFEYNKLNQLLPYDSKYTPNALYLFFAMLGTKRDVETAGWTKTSISRLENPRDYFRTTVDFNGGGYGNLDLSFIEEIFDTPVWDGTKRLKDNSLLYVEAAEDPDAVYSALVDEIVSHLETDFDIDWEATLADAQLTTIQEFVERDLIGANELAYKNFVAPHCDLEYGSGGSAQVAVRIDMDGSMLNCLYYPYYGSETGQYFYRNIRHRTGGFILSANGVDVNLDTAVSSLNVYRYKYTGTNPFLGVNFSFKSTLKKNMISFPSPSKKVQCYGFSNAFSAYDIDIGMLELFGRFLKPNRYGYQAFFEMSENPTAIPVPTSDWSEFWWDETPVEAIGQVKVIYTDTENNKQQQQTFTIGDGNSIYTIENNEALKASEMDTDTMQDILDLFFAPNASVVNFTPVELSMRGLPYLESGDYIELTAEDGETVETYILSQTISGIQHLTAEVTSTNGALLEVIENE